MAYHNINEKIDVGLLNVEFLPKVTDFNLPNIHLAPPLTLFEFHQDLWHQQIIVLGYAAFNSA